MGVVLLFVKNNNRGNYCEPGMSKPLFCFVFCFSERGDDAMKKQQVKYRRTTQKSLSMEILRM